MPFVLALFAAAFVALIIFFIPFAIIGFVLFMWIDIIAIGLLVYYKQYVVLLIGILLITLIRSILYRNQDLCAEACEKFTRDYCEYIGSEDDLKEQFGYADDKPIEHKTSMTRQYAYIITRAPHICHNQKTICYSQDNKYKVTIQHTGWNNYLFLLNNSFTVTREEIPDEKRALITQTNPQSVKTHQEQDTPWFIKGIAYFFAALFSVLGSIFLCWIEFATLAVLIFYKQYIAIVIGILFFALLTIIRTILYRNVDIFAEECENEVEMFRYSIHNTETLEQMVEHLKKNKDLETCPRSRTVRKYSYIVPIKPHVCQNQSIIIYSPDQNYKATITHNSWHQYLVLQKNTFTITEELLDHEK